MPDFPILGDNEYFDWSHSTLGSATHRNSNSSNSPQLTKPNTNLEQTRQKASSQPPWDLRSTPQNQKSSEDIYGRLLIPLLLITIFIWLFVFHHSYYIATQDCDHPNDHTSSSTRCITIINGFDVSIGRLRAYRVSHVYDAVEDPRVDALSDVAKQQLNSHRRFTSDRDAREFVEVTLMGRSHVMSDSRGTAPKTAPENDFQLDSIALSSDEEIKPIDLLKAARPRDCCRFHLLSTVDGLVGCAPLDA